MPDNGVPSFPHSEWLNIMGVWMSGQLGLPLVVRWKKYLESNGHGGVRLQNSLEHSYSLALLGKIVIAKIRQRLNFTRLDGELVITACLVHDCGEGELKRDVLYVDKTDQADLDEYLAFMKRCASLDSALLAELERAFLLQFARKIPACFPVEARQIMKELWRTKTLEVLAFEGIERLDYILYALEQFLERGNVFILTQVLRNQMEPLDVIASHLPGFEELFWTTEVRAWCQTLVEGHAHIERETVVREPSLSPSVIQP